MENKLPTYERCSKCLEIYSDKLLRLENSKYYCEDCYPELFKANERRSKRNGEEHNQ
jgi:formylmethanofuran dehydrogenase subunit E